MAVGCGVVAAAAAPRGGAAVSAAVSALRRSDLATGWVHVQCCSSCSPSIKVCCGLPKESIKGEKTYPALVDVCGQLDEPLEEGSVQAVAAYRRPGQSELQFLAAILCASAARSGVGGAMRTA